MRLKVSNVCQLLDKSTFWSTTRNGIKVTNNGDGTFTVNGTATYDNWFLQPVFQFQTSNPGYHTYLLDIGQYSGNANAHGVVYFYDDNVDSSVALIGTQDSSAFIRKINGPIPGRGTIIQARFAIVVLKGVTVTNWTIRPQLFDLTEMYGAGNEPTTVAQFRQDFPNEMYEYSPVCWKKFSRLKYIANKKPVQLLDKSKYFGSSTREGVTFTNNGDGTWTVVGTAPDVPANKAYVSAAVIIWNLEFSKKHFIPGHKIIVAGGVSIDSAGKVADVQWVWSWTGGYDAANSWERTVHTIRQYPEDKLLEYSNYIELRVYAGATVNFTFKPQFFDLTEMYGAGNEPATVAQFKADFPNELYDYNLYNYLTLNRGKYIANKEPVQLLDKSKYPATQTINGVTFTNNGDGTVTVNGTATALCQYKITNSYKKLIGENTNKCLLVGSILVDSSVPYYLQLDFLEGNSWSRAAIDFGKGSIFTNSATSTQLLSIIVKAGIVCDNLTFKPQLFDLTEMYGAGKEPTTVAQFKADFPNELYDYNPYNAITFR